MESWVVCRGCFSGGLFQWFGVSGGWKIAERRLTAMIRSKPEVKRSEWNLCADISSVGGSRRSATILATEFTRRR